VVQFGSGRLGRLAAQFVFIYGGAWFGGLIMTNNFWSVIRSIYIVRRVNQGW